LFHNKTARLKGIQRIQRKDGVFAIFKNGKQWECPELKIFFTENKLRYPRYIIAIPKKTGPAIVRNRIKRTIKEFLRKDFRATSCGLDIFVRYNPKNTAISNSEVKEALRKWCEILKKQQHG
jgi:ribonuclease P protein component